MCLYVQTSHVKNPIKEMKVYKSLSLINGHWYTPYTSILVPTNVGGLFCAKNASRRTKEYKDCDIVHGGYLHAHNSVNLWFGRIYNKLPRNPRNYQVYTFRAIAIDVVAVGTNNDVVCKELYIPAFDLRS